MSVLVARLILGTALMPFLWFAGRDQLLHLRARRVPVLENVIHLALGLLLLNVIGNAFRFDVRGLIFGTVVFIAAGALDEFVYHRGLPEVESDVHAKEHFALFGFVAVALAAAQVVHR